MHRLKRCLSCSDIELSVHQNVAPFDLPIRVKKCIMVCLLAGLFASNNIDSTVDLTYNTFDQQTKDAIDLACSPLTDSEYQI